MHQLLTAHTQGKLHSTISLGDWATDTITRYPISIILILINISLYIFLSYPINAEHQAWWQQASILLSYFHHLVGRFESTSYHTGSQQVL